MGRHPWTSRLTVEDCPIHLSTAELLAERVFSRPPGTTFVISWPLSDGSSLGSLRFGTGADWRGQCIIVRRQVFALSGTQIKGDGQTIRLKTTRPHFGGGRFWLICECGRRAGKLYLPTGETVFRCRICYDLTYPSSQEHNTSRAEMRAAVEMFHSYLLTPAQVSALTCAHPADIGKRRNAPSTAK